MYGTWTTAPDTVFTSAVQFSRSGFDTMHVTVSIDCLRPLPAVHHLPSAHPHFYISTTPLSARRRVHRFGVYAAGLPSCTASSMLRPPHCDLRGRHAKISVSIPSTDVRLATLTSSTQRGGPVSTRGRMLAWFAQASRLGRIVAPRLACLALVSCLYAPCPRPRLDRVLRVTALVHARRQPTIRSTSLPTDVCLCLRCPALRRRASARPRPGMAR